MRLFGSKRRALFGIIVGSIVAILVVTAFVTAYALSPPSGSSDHLAPSKKSTIEVINSTANLLSSSNESSRSTSVTINGSRPTNTSGWSAPSVSQVSWQDSRVVESISTSSPEGHAIFCGLSGINNSAETFCAMTLQNNSENIVSIGLQVWGNNTSPAWKFSLGITGGRSPSMFAWNFGDGRSATASSNQTVTHSYNGSGIFPVTTNFTISSIPNSSIPWEVETYLTIYVSSHISSNSNETLILDEQNGQATCAMLSNGVVGTSGWDPAMNRCTLSGNPLSSPTFLTDAGFTLVISPNVTLFLTGPEIEFANYGTIINNGTLTVQSAFDDFGLIVNHGTMNIVNNVFQVMSSDNTNETGRLYNTGIVENQPGAIIANGGFIENNGTIVNLMNASIYNNLANTSSMNNYGSINNAGYIQNRQVIDNYGTIENTGLILVACTGVINGKPISGNPKTMQPC